MNHREGRAATREPSSTNPDGSGPDTAAALCEAGLAHMAAGRFLDAQVCCTRALAINSGCADAFHLLGLAHAANGELDTAVELVVKAIKIDQTVADYFSESAVLMQRQNRFDEAFKSYDLALKLKTGLHRGLAQSRGSAANAEALRRSTADLRSRPQARCAQRRGREQKRTAFARTEPASGGACEVRTAAGHVARPRRCLAQDGHLPETL